MCVYTITLAMLVLAIVSHWQCGGVSQCVCVCTVALAVWRSFSVRVHNMLAMWASAGECVNSNTGCVDISVRACTHSTTGSVRFSQCVTNTAIMAARLSAGVCAHSNGGHVNINRCACAQ